TGPELQYGGAPVVAGEFTGAAPIAVEATATGYEVAWNVGSGQYSIWNTDSSGNYLSHALFATAGTSATLESFEPSFQQDLNGDGVIGIPGQTHALTGGTATIGAGATLELTAADSQNVTFDTSTGKLLLDHASTF